MNFQPSFQRWIRFLAVLAISCALSACAAFGPDIIDHSFGFDLRRNDQDAEVLDYWYGSPKSPVRAADYLVKEGHAFYFEGVTGPMNRPEALYVKWRNRNTGEMYEDTVDLRNRLPKNFAKQKVYFMIKGAQLSVYLISNELRPKDMPPNGPRAYQIYKITTIYPDQAKQ
jgi:hypothetical protein